MYSVGTIHHYDTIAYPQTTKFKTLYKRTFGRATAAIKNLWQAGQQSAEDEEEEFRRLKLSQMCDICLNFYLEDCYKALSECSFECIPTLINKIASVFYSLQSPLAIRDEDIILYNPQSQLCQVCCTIWDTCKYLYMVSFFPSVWRNGWNQ